MPFSQRRPEPSQTKPCGLSKSHRIALGGVAFIPDLSGALYCPDYKALIVADLHLEKASSLARRGVHLPPYDTRETLAQLKAVVDDVKPQRLIFLGDSFHDDEAMDRISDQDRQMLGEITSSVAPVWIAGNHDGALEGASLAANLGPVTLRHIPEPLEDGAFEIAGHYHPAAAIVQRGRRVRRKCFAANGERILMPAFGSFTGGLSVGSMAISVLFPDDHDVFLLGGTAVHKVPSSRAM
jgi:uncharacterized protein